MQEIIFIIHVLAAVSLIGLVLMQHGKGADAGAAFGSGASNTMFGSIGSMPFLIKVTAGIAIIFFTTSITLGVMVANQAKQSASKQLVVAPGVELPAAPPPTPAPVKK
jgi:preprotein translocase subunit SecG